MSKESAIFDQLPFDIVSTIFSFVHQADVLTCMAVCRAWYDRVPQYTEKLWRTIHITSPDVLTASYRRDRCLGSHVKSVVFETVPEEQLYSTMRKLVELGCDGIETLELVDCTTVDQHTFLAVLRQLATRLTHLKLSQHGSNLAILHLLRVCPVLTHFTYQPSYSAWKEQNIYTQEPAVPTMLTPSELDYQAPPTDQFDSLIYLHMNALLNLQLRLNPILQRCPNLQYFIGACAESCNRRAESIRLDDLFRWCPNIAYFADNGSYHQHNTPNDENIMTLEKGNSTTTTTTSTYNYYNGSDKEGRRTTAPLYHLAISEHHNGYHEQTVDSLLEHQDRLEYLKLVKFSSWYSQESFSWSSTFQTLQLPWLHTLICDYVSFDMTSIIMLLNASPNIQELDLSLVSQTLDQAILQPLDTLHHLRSLSLCGFSFDDELSVVALLERLPGLEKLVFESSSVAFAEPAYPYLTKLKHLELNKSKWERRTVVTRTTDEISEMAAPPPAVTKVIFKPALFHYLALHGSRLDTIRLVRLQDVNLHEKNLLFAIANLPALKCLDVRSSGKPLLAESIYDAPSAALCAFVKELHQKSASTLEELRLRCVRRLIRPVIDKLQDFSRLRVLDVQFSHDDPSLAMDTSGALSLLCKSTSLEMVTFSTATRFFDESSGARIKELLRKQIIHDYKADITVEIIAEGIRFMRCRCKD